MIVSHPAIRIQDLKKNYGNVQALRGVNLEVMPAEIFGFLGPNGAGKTTTIRCMLDLIRPNGGTIEILGQNPQTASIPVRRRIGYLPGELNMEGNLSVEGQLKYIDELRSHTTDWKNMQLLANRMELDLKTPIKNLSKGNKQKVGIIQALMGKPELLLLDEPTSGLDPLMQQEVYRLLKEVQLQGTTVFFSSQIINEVEAIAGRVAILRGGEIVQVTQPGQLTHMTVRQVRIRFKAPVDAASFSDVDGVSGVLQTSETILTLKLEGDMDALVKAAAQYPVMDIEVEQHSLEEVFLRFYRKDEKVGGEYVG